MQQDTDFPYTVSVNWSYGDTISDWDQKCIWAIDTFGLPGKKFITHLGKDSMDFKFKHQTDAIHFSLACL